MSVRPYTLSLSSQKTADCRILLQLGGKKLTHRLPLVVMLLAINAFASAQGPLQPHHPWAWRESFMHFERLEPASTADFALNGPVASLTAHTYYLDPEREPGVRPAVSRGPVMHSRHFFDVRGQLREGQRISAAGEAGIRYRYHSENGFYRGFSEERRQVSGGWSQVSSFQRRRVGDELVVAEWNALEESKTGEYRYRYDERERLLSVERYALDAPEELLERTTYRYADELLVESRRTEGIVNRTTVYEYAPHPLIEGQMLLTERNGYSDDDVQGGQPGQEVNLNPEHQNLLSARVVYYYHPDGSLAELHHFDVRYLEIGVREETLTKMEEFEDGRQVREISGPGRGHVISRIRSYLYTDTGRLVGETAWPSPYDSLNLDSMEYCEYRGFDEYGNWTEYACAYSTELSSDPELPKEFRGELVTREITYHH